MTAKLRGFAHMKKNNPERLAEIAAKGGSSVSNENRSFTKNRDLAVSAGRKGGEATRRTRTI